MFNVDVSGMSGDVVVVGIGARDYGYEFDFVSNGAWFINIDDATSKTNVYHVQGTFDPSVTNSITMTIRGTTASFELNSQQVGDYQGSGASPIENFFMFVGAPISEGVQADFQNFVFTPLH
jgi:hypothetical protein